jgi:hypothetical protein
VVTVDIDPARKLMIVGYGGEVVPAEAQKALRDAPEALARLEKGFRLLVDLTSLQKMDLACAPFIEEIMDLCQEKGVTDVVRVIPDPTRDIGMGIMSRFHYDSGVRIATCCTLDEALKMLSDNPAAE